MTVVCVVCSSDRSADPSFLPECAWPQHREPTGLAFLWFLENWTRLASTVRVDGHSKQCFNRARRWRSCRANARWPRPKNTKTNVPVTARLKRGPWSAICFANRFQNPVRSPLSRVERYSRGQVGPGRSFVNIMLPILLFALIQNASGAQPAPDPFAPLAVYNGTWTVKAEHPWSGGPPGTLDHLVSRCHYFTLYFACEQTINGKAQALLVYTISTSPGDVPPKNSTRENWSSLVN